MRTLLFSVLIVFLSMNLCFAQTQASLPVLTTPQGTVIIPIHVNNLNNVSSISLSFLFNTSILTYVGYQNTDIQLNNGVLQVNNVGNKVNISWYALAPATMTNSTLIEIVFTGFLGYGGLLWDLQTPGACQFTDININIIPSTFSNGNINIIGNGGKIEGTITYKNASNTPMVNSVIYLKQNGNVINQTITDLSGYYSFQPLSNGTYTVDCNVTRPWGGVNSVDALKIMQHFVGSFILTGINLKVADVDGSNYVNSADALTTMKRFTGMTTSFPIGDWKTETNSVIVANQTTTVANLKVLCSGDVNGSYVPSTCAPWPTTPNAGPDQVIVGTTTTLAANAPVIGTGTWSIISGTGGNIAQPNNPASTFIGLTDTAYALTWTISTTCASFSDTMHVFFCNSPTVANAGADQFMTTTSTILGGNVPTIGTGVWNIICGTGGVIIQPNNPTSSFSGTLGKIYTLTWMISTACGTSIDTVHISFHPNPCLGLSSFNYGGQAYNVVPIGTQCWMRENLNIGTMILGTQGQTNNGINEKYCYDDNPANCAIYGGLYQWDEIMQYVTTPGSQGICPSGWHIPTSADWNSLSNYLEINTFCSDTGVLQHAGAKLKEIGTTHWLSPNIATNESGFYALGAGYLFYGDASFNFLQQTTYFWSSTLSSHPIIWILQHEDYSFYKTNNTTNAYGFSVRCIKN